MLEKKIEASVCEYAKTRGVAVYKFTSPARAAVPDRLFIAPGGVMWFCEFKREGQLPTAPQAREHERLRALGVTVFVIDTIPDGRVMVDMMVTP
jgi:hypothetical protein